MKLSKANLARITAAIQQFAQFNRCHDIQIKKSNNKQFLTTIKAGL
ncbi:hypothetical protein [Paraflavitalea speifideaquila]|nr:hypothetical protein [Paraflavitalea speifideiaquila]